MGTLRYIINKLSESDSSYTIDLLVEEIVKLEKQLDEANGCVNALNLKNKELDKHIKELTRIDFKVMLE